MAALQSTAINIIRLRGGTNIAATHVTSDIDPPTASTPSAQPDIEGQNSQPTSALRTSQNDDVAAIRRRFEALNPYTPGTTTDGILELEGRGHLPGDLRQALQPAEECLRTAVDELEVGSGSKPGLAHVLPPRDLTPEDWVDQAWRLLAADDLGSARDDPEWLDPALTRHTITSPPAARSVPDL